MRKQTGGVEGSNGLAFDASTTSTSDRNYESERVSE
jgi:hypothetical protein